MEIENDRTIPFSGSYLRQETLRRSLWRNYEGETKIFIY